MDAGKEAFGDQTEESWNKVINWLTEHNQIKTPVKAADAFRNL